MGASVSDLLPSDLAERALGAERSVAQGGELVLLWIRGAMRAESNPALEVAIALASALDLPLLAYQALDDRHPHGSDRLWRFVLEGARELARDLDARGVRYAFHLVRPGHRTPALADLARRSAAVVADVHPVEPIRTWTERLAAAAPEVPVVEVDASCVVPVTETHKAYDRAFAFRKATSKARKRWLGWEPEEQPAPRRFEGELPFAPADLEGDLDALIAECAIDHGVTPIPHTRGGSSAGLARWNAFVERGLNRYARDRNDALKSGVSRMSAYFHFGMVSPLRVAAEAKRFGGAGAEKYLDELLVWREVAWHFCHHVRDVDAAEAALPAWAVETLREHASDERPALHSWDTLAHGTTGDELWDAMQTSLLRQGELHNNLRMTWGKALLEWTRGPEECLAQLLDLNHRYALDGRDPSSYGGILWCLGQFDRPFPPEGPVRGTVRERTTRVHAQRIDVQRYAERVGRPASGAALRVAVLGAGIAGLSAARAIRDAGHEVRVFDKARGVGGRTSWRRAEPFAFDHGAQYFTARDARFRRFVDAWCAEGVVAPYEGRIATIDAPGAPSLQASPGHERFVGVPGMNAMAVRMARGLDVTVRSRVTGLERVGDAWTLAFEDGREETGFDAVLITFPPAQAAELLATLPSPPDALINAARTTEMNPCWAAMVAFDGRFDAPFDGAFVNAGPLSWVSRDSMKPGRPEGDAWVLHASPQWTREHLELEREEAAAHLVAALEEATGVAAPAQLHASAHRWMYSAAAPPRDDEALFDGATGLGLAGDWLAGSKVQGAWLSGRALAGHVLRRAASAETVTAG